MTRSTLAALAVALAAVVALPVRPAAAQQPGAPQPQPRELSDVRETEGKVGLSLRPPKSARMIRQTADRYAFRIADDQGMFTMSVAISRLTRPLTLEDAGRASANTVLEAQGGNELTASEARKIAGRPAVVNYFRIRDLSRDREQRLMVGQAVVQIDPQDGSRAAVANTYAVIEVRGPLEFAHVSQPTFERVLESVQVTDPKQLVEERKARVQAGHEWRTKLKREQLHAAIVPTQWFRFVQQAKDGTLRDYGYMRMNQALVNRGGRSGIKIDVNARIQSGNFYFDTEAEYFLADDDSEEIWSTRTTQRPVNARPNNPNVHHPTYVQTGVRGGGAITVNVDRPEARGESFNFAAPPIGYLSQVESLMLPQIVPAARATFGFYYYNTNTNSITYRSDRVVPGFDGKSFSIVTQLSPNDPPLESQYGADRKLIEKQLDTEDNKLLPTTPAMIQQLWRGR